MNRNPKVFDVCDRFSGNAGSPHFLLFIVQFHPADTFSPSSPQLGMAYARGGVKALSLFVSLTACLFKIYTTSLSLTMFEANHSPSFSFPSNACQCVGWYDNVLSLIGGKSVECDVS